MDDTETLAKTADAQKAAQNQTASTEQKTPLADKVNDDTASPADSDKANGEATDSTDQGKKKKKRANRLRVFFTDFKAFISKGNIVNLAVAVVIGAAFSAIVTAFVNDFIMPLIALMVGKGGLDELKWTLVAANELGEGGIYILWGHFLQKIIDFLLIAFFIFLALRILVNAQKGITKTHKKWLKKLKKNPALADSAPDEVKEELKNATEAPKKIESVEDILKDIRTLLTALSPPPSSASDKPKSDPECLDQ